MFRHGFSVGKPGGGGVHRVRVTTRSRVRRPRSGRESAARVVAIMATVGVRSGTRLWAGIVLVVLSLFAAPLGSAATSAHPDGDHAHAVVAGPYGHHPVIADHDHIDAADGMCAPDSAADALFLRARNALLAVGVVVGFAVLWVLRRSSDADPSRAPPRSATLCLAGRDVLTRLCVDRC